MPTSLLIVLATAIAGASPAPPELPAASDPWYPPARQLLLNAIAAAYERIEAQQQIIERQQAQIDELERRLAALETSMPRRPAIKPSSRSDSPARSEPSTSSQTASPLASNSPSTPSETAPRSALNLPKVMSAVKDSGAQYLPTFDGTQSRMVVMVDREGTLEEDRKAVLDAKRRLNTVLLYVGGAGYLEEADGYIVGLRWGSGIEENHKSVAKALATGKPVVMLVDGRNHDNGRTDPPDLTDGRPGHFERVPDAEFYAWIKDLHARFPSVPICYWSVPADWFSYYSNANTSWHNMVKKVIDLERSATREDARTYLMNTAKAQVRIVEAAVNGKPCPGTWRTPKS